MRLLRGVCAGLVHCGWAFVVVAIVSLIFAGACVAEDGRGNEGFSGAHRSTLKIHGGAPLPITKRVTIGLDKSMLIEVPADLNSVLVSNPEVIDAVVQTSRQVYLLAKDVGEANAFFMGPDGRRILLLEVRVTRDLAALSDVLHRLIPGAQIKVEPVGDNVALTGSVPTAIDATRATDLAARYVKRKDGVINMLNVDSKEQVMLRVTVTEMQRNAIKRLGVDIPGAIAKAGNVTFAKVVQNAFPITSSIVPEVAAGTAGGLPGVVAGGALQATYQKGSTSISALLNMLERSGLSRTLAEPNLTAISGETAKFLAGGEFPVPIVSGDRQVSVQWKTFGVGLNFKPVVMTGGRISLNIAAEVSELSNDGAVTLSEIAISALKVRRAETTLELPSGGTLMMAGLLSDDTRQSAEGIPGLKRLPILGALFRSNDFLRRETELVILVTPMIVKSGPRAEFAKPDVGFAPASDLQSIFLGHVNRVYGRPGHKPNGRYEGDFGFIIEYPRGGGTKG